MKRLMVTIHLPMEMGAAGRILAAVAREFPDATIRNLPDAAVGVEADDDPSLTESPAAPSHQGSPDGFRCGRS